MKYALSIAGFDPSTGAGVTRDIVTFRKVGLYGLGVVTAVTYQNTSKVYGFVPLRSEEVGRQIDAIMDDFNVKYVKVGLVPTKDIADTVAKKIDEYDLTAVVDPILESSTGYEFSKSMEHLRSLIKRAFVITPNVPEAEVLSGIRIKGEEDAIRAAKKIYEDYGINVIVKGGHLEGVDYLYDGELTKEEMEHLGKDIHGTGCAYSSALVGHLALGYPLRISFRLAREFLQTEIRSSMKIAKRELLP